MAEQECHQSYVGGLQALETAADGMKHGDGRYTAFAEGEADERAGASARSAAGRPSLNRA